MKVGIHYKIDLEEVPDHLEELFNTASRRLTVVANESAALATKIKSRSFPTPVLVRQIVDLRLEMERVDSLYADFASILTGYEQTLLKLSKPPEEVEGHSEAEE